MANMSPLQERLVGLLKQPERTSSLQWDELRGVVRVLRGRLADAVDASARPEETVRRFLQTFGALFGPPEILTALRPLRSRTDDQGRTHLEYQQEFRPSPKGSRRPGAKGKAPVPVYGAKLAAHVARDGTLYEVQSSCWSSIDVKPRARITIRSLQALLTREAAAADDFVDLRGRMRRTGEKQFPIMRRPRQVLYYWNGRFRLVWSTYAYQPLSERDAGPRRVKSLELAQLFVDAETGDIVLSAPTTMHAVETPVVGSGVGVTPLGAGGPAVRPLNVVQIDTTPVHRLKDKTHARDLITYDVAGLAEWSASTQLTHVASAAVAGTLPVSENAGGSAWTRVAPSAGATDADRITSQQPEVDAHFHAQAVYEWYDALAGGRAGWDDGQFSDPPVPKDLPIRLVTHVINDDHPVRLVDAFCQKFLVGGRWQVLIFLGDGDPDLRCATSSSPADRSTTYLAGSPNIVAHEYQHAVTGFSFQNDDDPGFPYRYWGAVVHEGLSDTFGCFFSDVWQWGPEISAAQLVFRNAVYPRDPLAWGNRPGTFPCSFAYQNKDHFADQTVSTDYYLTPQQDASQAYQHGTILAHCAYLMGVGGVQERLSRKPALIPVSGLGMETRNGKTFRKAARIWYDALTVYMATHTPPTSDATLDATLFSSIREGAMSSILAPGSYGAGSLEHRTTELAFYAVGIRPLSRATDNNPYYGADVTFLRWGAEWFLSRPYLGGIYATCPDWASVDLFVNNGGGASGWNAIVDVAGNANPVENQVYCRVRNVGDMDAENVTVSFWYAKVGPFPVVWMPMLDSAGVAQTLNVGALAAGEMTFADTRASQDSPPASAMVKWHIPPLAPDEPVDHFCIRAVVTAANDVNPYNNEVQSNIAYSPYMAGPLAPFKFVVSVPAPRHAVSELVVAAQLPPGWSIEGPASDPLRDLPAGEERVIEMRMVLPARAAELLDPPFDGSLTGRLSGPLSGEVHGALTGTGADPERLSGRVALALDELGTLVGRFDGSLDVLSGAVRGRVAGDFQNAATGGCERVGVRLDGTLSPWRRIDVSQLADGQPIGGFTIEITGAGPVGGRPRPQARRRRA